MISETLKLKVSIFLLTSALFMVGCSNERSFGKLDKTPYATKECLKTLSIGGEIEDNCKIDKIVVYKKKRRLYTYLNGKKIAQYIMKEENDNQKNKREEH